MRHVAEILRRKCKIVIGSTDTHMVARGIEAMADALDEAQRLHDDAQAFDLRRPAVQAFIVRGLARRAYLTEGEAWDDLSTVFAAVAELPGRDRDEVVEEMAAEVQRLRPAGKPTAAADPDDLIPEQQAVLDVLCGSSLTVATALHEHGPQTRQDLVARLELQVGDVGDTLRLLIGQGYVSRWDTHPVTYALTDDVVREEAIDDE